MGHKIKIVLVTMIRMEDNVSVEFEDEWDDSDWWWREGNGSCDCNRYIFFSAALEKVSREQFCAKAEDIPCSEGKYRVSIKDKITGLMIYSELSDG